MPSVRLLVAVLWVGLTLDPGGVRAERRPLVRLSGFVGVRAFSENSSLGSPSQTSLSNSVVFGLRAVHEWKRWLSFEGELPVMVTGSRDDSATVLFFDPRLHAISEFPTPWRVRPFAIAGVGAPVALSSNRPRFNSDILPEGYLGLGAKFDRELGWSVRVDARLALLPGRGDAAVTTDVEVFVSLYHWTESPVRLARPRDFEKDSDGDGLVDADDTCPDRAEDRDGYKDGDGCPDIDDDRDEVLDIADACKHEPETWNGFEDDDGCPDVVPAEIMDVSGVIAGLEFRGRTATLTRPSYRPLDKIAGLLLKYPSVRGRIVGHTDDQGEPEANLDLSQQRADVVKYYLVEKGVKEYRLGAVGVGGDAPLGDNTTAKGRAKNHRVEFHIRRRDR